MVTIDGIRLGSATKVTFDGLASEFEVVSDAEITATVPPGATTGQIRIFTPAGIAGSGPSFKVT